MAICISKSDKLTEKQVERIDLLWNEVYPVNLNNRLNLLLAGIKQYNHYLLLGDSEELIGWAVAFLRDQETWFSILVAPAHQNKGYGKILIDSLKHDFNTLCGWVIDHDNDLKQDGTGYLTPIPFYLKAGFKILTERIETDIISAVKIKFEYCI
jgi:GNAT superfamily N-acetyltransferase